MEPPVDRPETAEPEAPPPPPPFCTVVLDPPEAEAGELFELSVRLEGDLGRALKGREVVFLDTEGEEIARATLDELVTGGWGSEPVRATAPRSPGAALWTVALVPETEDEEVQMVDFEVPVRAHRIAVRVWDVPDVVEAGTTFRVRVAAKCVAGCPSQGWAFAVQGEGGAVLAEGRLGDTPWPGTEGLVHAEVELAAPAEVGSFRWSVIARAPEDAGLCAHAARPAPLLLRTGPAPEVTLRVEVVDAETGAPVPRATVVAHPYRGRTDAAGLAELRLPRGRYTVLVSGGRYFALEKPVELTGDDSLRAEMIVDREFSVEDAWG